MKGVKVMLFAIVLELIAVVFGVHYDSVETIVLFFVFGIAGLIVAIVGLNMEK